MNFQDFINGVFAIQSDKEFYQYAMYAFGYQYEHNLIYKNYADHTKRTPSCVKEISQIPFMPISFFKDFRIISGNHPPELIFGSSGTTGTRSFHYVVSAEMYRQSLLNSFELAFGSASNYAYVCLLPTYAERNDSSLLYMAQELISRSKHPLSGFYLDAGDDSLKSVLLELEQSGQPAILLGVTFALVELAQLFSMPFKSVRIVETGGMKGRGKEMIRQEVHQILRSAFSVETVYSEYGMTELLSQAYMQADGLFHAPPWMRVMCREIEDPFQWANQGTTGGINVIDLANIHSCCFIETQDLGKLHSNNKFEVMGRFDHSDVRGCNLLVM